MAKYLDSTGVQTLWTAVKEQDATNLAAAKNYTDGKDNTMGSRVSTLEGYFTSGVANEAAKATKDGNNDVIANTYVKVATKGQANGVCPLDANAKVAAAYLPGYVDDIIEGYYYQDKFYEESAHTTEIAGEGGKLYVDKSTNTTYRWSGTQFTMVSESISIGTTQGTAYDGAAGATMRSDVNALQTAVTTTIPATYVPIEGSTATTNEYSGGGLAYPTIYNNTGKITLINARRVDGETTHTTRVDVKVGEVNISSRYYPTTDIATYNESFIKVEPSNIYLQTTNLYTKAPSDLSYKTVATVEDMASTYVPKQSTGTDRSALIQNTNGAVSIQSTYKDSNVNKRAGLIHFDSSNKYGPKLSWIDLEQSPQGGNDAANFKINDNGIAAYINKTYMPNATFTYNGNEVATTDQIPSVEAITSQELAAILV